MSFINVLKALDGFYLVVNRQGNVEFVSPNVTKYINYMQVLVYVVL